jgi:hypothetical protein
MIKVFCDNCKKEINHNEDHVRIDGRIVIDTMSFNGKTDAPGFFCVMNNFSFCSLICISEYIKHTKYYEY